MKHSTHSFIGKGSEYEEKRSRLLFCSCKMLFCYFVFFSVLILCRRHESYAFQLDGIRNIGIGSAMSRKPMLISATVGASDLGKDIEGSLDKGGGEKRQIGQVYVCTNRWCREKGSEATMATFSFLCPDSIPIKGVNCLGRCNKGPNTRILTRDNEYVEASMVRSVDTVVSLLKTHLSLDVNTTSAEALRLNYEGNVHLRNGDVDKAIDCYNTALGLGDGEQEGILLVMRGTALLQRCYVYRMRFRSVIPIAKATLPSIQGIVTTIEALEPLNPYARALTVLELLLRANEIFEDIEASSMWNVVKAKWPEDREGAPIESGDELLDKCLFTWYSYKYALVSAMEDLLQSTVTLPGFPQAWRRAGDALREMKFFTSAMKYYQVAIDLDPSFSATLSPEIEKLKALEEVIENAQSKGWSTESIISLMDSVDID